MMKRKIMAFLIGASLLLSVNGPALASEKVSADEAVGVNDVIAKYNESVEKSYLGKAEDVDAGLITDAELLKQLENKNKYLANAQSPYQVINHEFDFKVLETKVSGDKAAVLGERVIKQKLSDKANKSEAFDSFVKEKEGYVLVKRDGKWVIDRVIIGFGDASPALQDFESQLKEKSVVKNKTDNRIEQIKLDFVGIDYEEAVKEHKVIVRNKIERQLPDDQNNKADKALQATGTADAIQVTWNGKTVAFPDQQPMIKDGRTLVPLRFLVNQLPGYGILPIREVISVQPMPNPNIGKPYMIFTIGQSNYLYHDPTKKKEERRILYRPLEVMNGRTMMSVRNIGELFGQVKWDPTTRTVHITTEGSPFA